MNKIAIINGRIIDPATHTDVQENIYIADGKIIAQGSKEPSDFKAERIIDAKNLIVSPGFIDLDAKIMTSSHDEQRCINEITAALSSGITTLCLPPSTNDLLQDALHVEWFMQNIVSQSKLHILPIGALTLDLAGTQLNELAMLKEAGCVAVTNDSYGIKNTKIKQRCYEYAATLDLKVFIYAINTWLKDEGCVHEGEVSTRLGLKGIPSTTETTALAEELLLIEETGVSAHICRLSSARSVDILSNSSLKNFTADVAAHQLLLTEIDISDFNSTYHVYPPLRAEKDRFALQKALRDKVISAVCSHHQPLSKMAKYAPFPETEPGVSTLETLLAQTLRIAKEMDLPLIQALSWITDQPAKILNIDKGTLQKGKAADICIFNAEKNWTLTQDNIKSHGQNSPFLNWDFTGEVAYTLIDGEIVYESIVTP